MKIKFKYPKNKINLLILKKIRQTNIKIIIEALIIIYKIKIIKLRKKILI